MDMKKELIEIWEELWPYIKFLLNDVLLIFLTICTMKLIIFILKIAFGEEDVIIINMIEMFSQVGIAVMFLLHTLRGIISLSKTTIKEIQSKNGKKK